MTEAEKDEYSQCIACETVVDNEFISEHGLCVECLRIELSKVEGNILKYGVQPYTRFCFIHRPIRPTSKAIRHTAIENKELLGDIEITINASTKGRAWSMLKSMVVQDWDEWKLK